MWGKMEAPDRFRDLRAESVWALSLGKSPESWLHPELLGTQHNVGLKEISVWCPEAGESLMLLTNPANPEWSRGGRTSLGKPSGLRCLMGVRRLQTPPSQLRC